MLKLLFSVILGFISAFIWEFFSGKIIHQTALILYGYRLHHSLYGIASILYGTTNKNHFLIGFGIGIIIQHTLTDGFRFISLEPIN